MPYERPTLTDLRNQVAQDIAASLPASDPLLRFSNLAITGVAQANLANLHYGYLDWIALQANPFTATDEALEGWAALKRVYRKPASAATGTVTFSGVNGTAIPAGSRVVRGDGMTGLTLADGVVAGGVVAVNVRMDADPSGVSGAVGNAAPGASMTLSQAIAGVQSGGVIGVAFTGGADVESSDELRNRMLIAYQREPQGGSIVDYVEWALSVPGVTRAWCLPNAAGVGTVSVHVMLDVSNAAYDGFPQGGNGVAAGEPRAAPATGDQLTVANVILPLQPVTALVYVMAPTAHPVDFSISGIPVARRTAATEAIADVFFRDGSAAGGSIPIAYVWSAIASVSGVSDFVIASPSIDISHAAGTLPTVGSVAFA